MATSKTTTDNIAQKAKQLAEVFEMTMHQLMLLGHHLPQTAESMTPQQLKVISALAFADTPLSMSEVSSRVGVTKSTLSDVSKRLVRMGLLDRERSQADDRIVNLSLSEEGIRVFSEIRQSRLKLFQEICNDLEPGACDMLINSHQYIAETYRDVLQKKGR